MLELRDKHRRYAVERRATLFLNRAETRFRIKRFGGQNDCAPVSERCHVAENTTKAMVKRHRQADPVAGRVAKPLSDEKTIVQNVVVRERGALRRAGGAGGVLNADRIVELKRRFPFA